MKGEAKHCSTLKNCSTLQITAKHCKTLQITAEHCSVPLHTAAHCCTLLTLVHTADAAIHKIEAVE